MKFIRPHHRPLLGLLVKRSVLFLALMSLLLLFLYGVGNNQGFMDFTQILLLTLLSVASLLVALLSVVGMALDVFIATRSPRKARYLAGASIYLCICILFLFLALGVSFIEGVIQGT